MQADPHFLAIGQTGDAITANQVNELFGEPCTQGQGVEILYQAVQLANAPGMEPQHGFVQLDMGCQNFLEIRFGHAQDRTVAMGVGIVGTAVAVEDGYIAEPDTRLDVGEGDLLARDGGGTDPHRTFGAGNPFLWRVAARCNQFAVLVSLDVCASEYVVSQ